MTKGRRYMTGSEFNARQSVFEFLYSRAVEFLEAFRRDCLKGWGEIFKKPEPTPQERLKIDFRTVTGAFWAAWTPERNKELFTI